MGLTGYRYRLFALLAGVFAAPLSTPVSAQADPPATTADDFDLDQPLDPDKPMTDIPDFGVEWPDMEGAEDVLDPDHEDVDEELSSFDTESESGSALSVETGQGAEELEELDNSQIFQPVDALAASRYRVSFSGKPEILGKAFQERFDALSALEQYSGEDANFAQIKRRAETDRELVEQLLRINGYYDAVVRTRFEVAPESGSSDDVSVIIDIAAGPQYRYSDISLPGLSDAADSDVGIFRGVYGLQVGEVINSDDIVTGQIRLEDVLTESGYPFASTGEPDLIIDHADRDGNLTQPVSPGGKYRFGSITMEQTDLFGPKHVQLIARFEKGDLYKQSDVQDLRRALISTGLVSTVSLDPVKSDTPGEVDLAVNVTPAPLRTIAGELGYGTGEGLRTEVSWEHRNFFPPEGLIRLTGVAATQEQSASITFRRNNFQRRDNILNASVALSNIERAAFSARTFSIAANIERQSNLIYQKRWSWSAGVELLASQERDVVGQAGRTNRQTFFIGALPANILYDASDDLLDPKKGFRLGARISPEASLQNGSFYYVRGQIDVSAYLPVSEKVTLAGRARIGSIVGAGNNRIAPSRRLYSGGGGSVRGYGYQRIGPLDANNDPVGGRSLVEFSLESRVKTGFFGGNLGIVPFVDAGNIYTNPLPRFSGMRYGAGLGVRYYSDFGPIRIDVGTPINPQPGDSRIAVYVSLGQAF